MYIYICIDSYTFTHIYISVCIYLYVYIYMLMFTCKCMYIYIYFLYVCIYCNGILPVCGSSSGWPYSWLYRMIVELTLENFCQALAVPLPRPEHRDAPLPPPSRAPGKDEMNCEDGKDECHELIAKLCDAYCSTQLSKVWLFKCVCVCVCVFVCECAHVCVCLLQHAAQQSMAV